jgi:nitrate/nitrite transporter NarK
VSRAAAALGFGNGAVFKLVPQFFPKETGTGTGLVLTPVRPGGGAKPTKATVKDSIPSLS